MERRTAAHAAQGAGQLRGGILLAPAAILEALPDAVVAAASDGRIVFVNALAEELFGYERDELLGQPVELLWPERLRERYLHNVRRYFDTERPLRFSHEAWGRRRDGTEFVGEMSWGIAETASGPLLLAIGRDLSERRATEARLRAVAAMGEWALTDSDPADLAAHAADLLRAVLPTAGVDVRLGHEDEPVVVASRELSAEEQSFVQAMRTTLATGLARLRGEERLRHEAVHDALTGLANRVLLHDRLSHALARSERDGLATGVLFVDLDNFKGVNDAFGHATGDQVLAEVGRRLEATLRPGDTIARFGGDEFVAVCEQVDRPVVLSLARRLQSAIARPVATRAGTHHLTASIGIALGGADSEALLAEADAAVYRAKTGGGGRFELSGEPAG